MRLVADTFKPFCILKFIADVYIPSRTYIGRFGAILATFLASAMLHVSLARLPFRTRSHQLAMC